MIIFCTKKIVQIINDLHARFLWFYDALAVKCEGQDDKGFHYYVEDLAP